MIKLDSSIIYAIIIFILLIATLNQLLFKPLARVLAERESRTVGLQSKVREQIDNQLALFDRYQATIKNARMEGYRRQEQLRADAEIKQIDILTQARNNAEQVIQGSRDTIHAETDAAKQQLTLEAQELAQSIASAILDRGN